MRLWGTQSGVAVIVLRDMCRWSLSVHWSADGEWLVSASLDGTVRIWDARGLASLVPSPARETWLGSKTALNPEKPLIKIPCVAIFFASGDGLLAARPDESSADHKWLVRATGIGTTSSFHGAGLCRFTLAEIAKWQPKLLMNENDRIF